MKQETVFNIEKVPKDEHPSNQPRIGKLTLDERLVKVRRYIEKRYRRKWLKKVITCVQLSSFITSRRNQCIKIFYS